MKFLQRKVWKMNLEEFEQQKKSQNTQITKQEDLIFQKEMTQKLEKICGYQKNLILELKDSLTSHNALFKRSIFLTKLSIGACCIFALLVVSYTMWLFKISKAMDKIEKNNSTITEIFVGDKKLWYNEKNHKIYLKNKKIE